jgi:hypothetical protein
METRDPFIDDVSVFEPRKPGVKSDQKEVEKARQAAGYNDRSPKPAKEKIVALTFRLPESEARRFKKQALEEYEGEYPSGAYVYHFRKMWREHDERAGD